MTSLASVTISRLDDEPDEKSRIPTAAGTAHCPPGAHTRDTPAPLGAEGDDSRGAEGDDFDATRHRPRGKKKEGEG